MQLARNRYLLVLLGLFVLTSTVGCQSKADKEMQKGLHKLTLAFQATPYSGLIAIADEKGFFKENGLDVTLKRFPSGLECLNVLRSGEAQLATVADIAFAGKIEEDRSLRIVASIGLTVGNLIVARKDRHIIQPADLQGKKVGYSPNTTSDYFLHAFLLANHLLPADITLVSIAPGRQVEVCRTGRLTPCPHLK